ncbi:DUF262 domain-containing protein [Colidextribacter sp. OB.20]|uniref:GmrSD restriction endonuclease domain-containing protein n=1 Tax=Colidextribacter sp. OB.20 TaxID=2304568 RepID=UPI001371CBD1
MKAITANPETIREVFSKRYIIPDFQRPYSWDNDPSEKLWDDIIDFYEGKETKEDKYFLGNIVINPASDLPYEAWEVVDGQQRLTTLLLLIKALHSRAGTVKALEECLRIKDPLTSELTDELRASSFVISQDREDLHTILLGGAEPAKSRLLDNYRLFGEKIDEWWQSQGQTAEALNRLILTLLDSVVLLPIHCGSEDDALTIFETINNRGMSLSDADIFKAKLYHNIPQEDQAAFIEDWNALEDHDWLFRVLMHILRAKTDEAGKEIGLRSYFSAQKGILGDYAAIMRSLKIIHTISVNWYGNDEINALWRIMETYPNYYWYFPLFVFLHKHGTFDEEGGGFSLPEKRLHQFLELQNATVRYFFIKGLVYNAVNAVKDTVYRVCADIEQERDYLASYEANISRNDRTALDPILHGDLRRRYQRGVVLLSAYLNPNQDRETFSQFMDGKYDIEHILPKKWNNYDGWTDALWRDQLNNLGNLIPLGRALNIAAKNEFFVRKKEEYAKSAIQDAQDLLALPEWTPDALIDSQEEKIARLLKYFRAEP